MRLRLLPIESFRSIKKLEIELPQVCAVVGLNNAGKPRRRSILPGIDVRESGRLGALATNNNLSKRQRSASGRKVAQARWAKTKR